MEALKESPLAKAQREVAEQEKHLEEAKRKLDKLQPGDSLASRHAFAARELQEANRIERITQQALDDLTKEGSSIVGRFRRHFSYFNPALRDEEIAKTSKALETAQQERRVKQSAFSKLDREAKDHKLYKEFHAEQKQICQRFFEEAEKSWTASVMEIPDVIFNVEALARQERTLCINGNAAMHTAGLPELLIPILLGAVTTVIPCSPIPGTVPTEVPANWDKKDMLRNRAIAMREIHRLKSRLAEMA